MTLSLHAMRRTYQRDRLDESCAPDRPFELLNRWLQNATDAELLEPNAMMLATIDEEGLPATRTVLLKGLDDEGLVFYTNYGSAKARHIERNPNVALQFLWLPLERQIKIVGRAEKLSRTDSLRYFLSRPRGSQLGAWVSPQSEVISGHQVLMAEFEKLKQKFRDKEIPLPDFWGGYRIVPHSIEFWQGGEDRLHDRLRYRRDRQQTGPVREADWQRERLAP